MKASKTTASREQVRLDRPALTPEARENQVIAKAYDLAEERIANGTASPSEIVHFLKLGSAKAKLEKEQMEEEIKLLRAKTEMIEASKDMSKIYSEAIDAMKMYSGVRDA